MTSKAKDTEPAKAEEPKTETYQVVRFTGRPGLRLLLASDWAGAGVPDHADTLWGPVNDWIVKRSDLGELTDEQYSRIILADPNFREETVTVPVAE